MENEVRQRKPIHFSWRLEKKWCINGVWGVFGSVLVKKEMGKTVNSHKKSREKLKKFKETVFETQNTCFSRLKQVARANCQQVARASHQNYQSQNCENFLSVFRDWKFYPRGSRELNCENLCVPLMTGPFTREQVAKNNTQACSYSMRLRWPATESTKTGQHCFWNFSVFVKTKYFPKTPKTLKNIFEFESTKIEHVETHFNKYNHTNEYDIHWT